MNRENLQRLASEWVRMAKNDIRKKVVDFIEEVDTTPRELAYHLAMSEGELEQIINGNGEITITTFAKLLIATGNALEIKPIDETPLGGYENIPDDLEFDYPLPRPNMFERPRPMPHPIFGTPTSTQQPTQGHFARQRQNPQQPTQGHFQRAPFGAPIPEEIEEEEISRDIAQPQPRDERGRFAPRQQRRIDIPTSPFASKSSEELEKIIRERLWDSEINLSTASKEELVKFLDEKDKRMTAYKRMKELEEDPSVNEFKNRMKRTFNNNPHLREWAKKFLGELAE